MTRLPRLAIGIGDPAAWRLRARRLRRRIPKRALQSGPHAAANEQYYLRSMPFHSAIWNPERHFRPLGAAERAFQPGGSLNSRKCGLLSGVFLTYFTFEHEIPVNESLPDVIGRSGHQSDSVTDREHSRRECEPGRQDGVLLYRHESALLSTSRQASAGIRMASIIRGGGMGVSRAEVASLPSRIARAHCFRRSTTSSSEDCHDGGSTPKRARSFSFESTELRGRAAGVG